MPKPPGQATHAAPRRLQDVNRAYREEQGLLHPHRLPGGYRAYTETDVTTVEHIRDLLAADLLPCRGSAGGQLIADCPELLLDLHRERTRPTNAITELTTARNTPDRVIATAPPSVEHAAARLRDAGWRARDSAGKAAGEPSNAVRLR